MSEKREDLLKTLNQALAAEYGALWLLPRHMAQVKDEQLKRELGLIAEVELEHTHEGRKSRLGDFYDLEFLRIGLGTLAGVPATITDAEFTDAADTYIRNLFDVCKREVDESVQSTRPFSYFAVSNIAALAFVCGPAVVVGLTRLRDRAMWLLVGGALAAVALANASALSKGEVERIWLPFAVWILPAAGALIDREPDRQLRVWLAAQMTAALVLQTFVRTNW